MTVIATTPAAMPANKATNHENQNAVVVTQTPLVSGFRCVIWFTPSLGIGSRYRHGIVASCSADPRSFASAL